MPDTIRIYDRHQQEVPIDSIECLIASGNYTFVHRKDVDRPLLVSRTIKDMAARLPGFIRIHKSTVINPDHVVRYQIKKHRESQVHLSGERILFVSRRYATPELYVFACKHSSSLKN